jgi:hypothetical protein
MSAGSRRAAAVGGWIAAVTDSHARARGAAPHHPVRMMSPRAAW